MPKSIATPSGASCGELADDDFELLKLWAEGDRASGDLLFTRHVEAVRRFFANKVVDSADLIQATFLACLEQPTRFQGKSSFRTYLLSIAKFKLYHHYRLRGTRRERMRLQHNTSSIFDRAPSPSTLLAHADRDRNLLLALRRIPLQLQLVLELAYWEELSGAELAEVLDVPVRTVYARMHRAKQCLRRAVDELEASH